MNIEQISNNRLLPKERSHKRWIWAGVISCWLVCLFEIITERWFSTHFPTYDWKIQSISYLGQVGSPVEHLVAIWGVVLFVFFTFFGIGLSLSFRPPKWSIAGGLCLILYGLGEGLGSGLFPPSAPDMPYGTNAFLHDLFSGIGDIGLIVLPFLMMMIFPKEQFPVFSKYLWSVVIIGGCLISFFLLAKFAQPTSGFLVYKGLWQRCYMFNYFFFLLVISIKMIPAQRMESDFSCRFRLSEKNRHDHKF